MTSDLSSQVKKLLGDVVAPKPDEEDDDLGVERNLQTSQPADDAMEPVAFLETTWNLVLVLGHASVGWVDVIIAWLLLVASAGIQITFSWILTSESFLGEPFDERQVETALSWRRSVAHDHTYLDLAHTSLTSRVCNNDGSLIISTEQAALIQRINSFLNLEVHELEATDFRLGILLAMLCILLWCLYLCNEFRTIFLSLEAVAQIPRRPKTTFQNGRFETISFARFWAYCLLRILRACIAGTLLYAGILWLGSTTSITDLILNAVALGAILEVDAMVFSALMPKKLQLKVQDLEAIKVQYSRCRSQTESLCILVILAALLAWPWFVLVQPLGQTMEAVKQAHCGGHQDFVIGLNKDQNMPVGFQSIPFNRSADKTLTQLAVDDYLFKEDIQATYITFHSDIGRFQKYQTQTMKEAASEHTWCADLDIFFQAGSEFVDPRHAETASYYRPHFMSAILGLGFPSNSSCADMQEKCDDPNGQLLRYVCGQTCCSNPLGSPWFKVPAKGCPITCLAEAGQFGACKDQTSQVGGQMAWKKFWNSYPSILEAELGEALNLESENSSLAASVKQVTDAMKAYGCSALGIPSLQKDSVQHTCFHFKVSSCDLEMSSFGFHSSTECSFFTVTICEELVMSQSWCEGYEELWAPLARLCPETCGCTNLTNPSEA